MEDVSQVSPEDLFLEGGEPEPAGDVLLHLADWDLRLTSLLGGLGIEPGKTLRLEIVPKKLDGKRMLEIDALVARQRLDPGPPGDGAKMPQDFLHVCELGLGVVLDGLPEVLG